MQVDVSAIDQAARSARQQQRQDAHKPPAAARACADPAENSWEYACCRVVALSTHLRIGVATEAQASRRISALRLRSTTRREVGRAMAAFASRWVSVRETVSMVNPR